MLIGEGDSDLWDGGLRWRARVGEDGGLLVVDVDGKAFAVVVRRGGLRDVVVLGEGLAGDGSRAAHATDGVEGSDAEESDEEEDQQGDEEVEGGAGHGGGGVFSGGGAAVLEAGDGHDDDDGCFWWWWWW